MVHPAWYQWTECWSCHRQIDLAPEVPQTVAARDVVPTLQLISPLGLIMFMLCVTFPVLPLIGLLYLAYLRSKGRKQTELVYDPSMSNQRKPDAPGIDTGWTTRDSVIRWGDAKDSLWDPNVGRWRTRGDIFTTA